MGDVWEVSESGDLDLAGNITLDPSKTVDGVDVSAHDTATTGVHGVTGDIVGTSDSQVLTNKRLDSPKINENVILTATATQLNTAAAVSHAQNTDTGTTSTTFEIDNDATAGVVLSASGQTVGDHTFTFPNSSDEIVGKDAGQTLTNKTLPKATTTIDGTTSSTFEIQFGGPGSAVLDTLSLSAPRTFYFPDNANPQTLVGETSLHLLTNKTLDDNTNVIRANKIRETGGPTVLTVGAVPDDQLFIRSGTTLIGVSKSALQALFLDSITVAGGDVLTSGGNVVYTTL